MEEGKSLFPCIQQGELSLLVLICICPQSVPTHLEPLDQHSQLSEETQEETQGMGAAKLALEKKQKWVRAKLFRCLSYNDVATIAIDSKQK